MINPYAPHEKPTYDHLKTPDSTESQAVNEQEVEKTDEQIQELFTQTWEAGDRIGAIEIVLGRYINASDIQADKDLATIVMQPDADKAYAAASMVKMLEQMAKEASQGDAE